VKHNVISIVAIAAPITDATPCDACWIAA